VLPMDTRDASIPDDYLTAQMGWVRELARSLLSNPSDADDVAQDVWLAARERSPESGSSPRAWLSIVTRRIVQMKGRSDARRRQREGVVSRPESQPSEDDVLARGETCQRIVAAVMTLGEPYRSTVLRRYLDGLSTAEIAAHDGTTEIAVRKRLSRAMQELRAQLDQDFDGGRAGWIVALFDVTREGRSGAVPTLGGALGGLVIMKKVRRGRPFRDRRPAPRHLRPRRAPGEELRLHRLPPDPTLPGNRSGQQRGRARPRRSSGRERRG